MTCQTVTHVVASHSCAPCLFVSSHLHVRRSLKCVSPLRFPYLRSALFAKDLVGGRSTDYTRTSLVRHSRMRASSHVREHLPRIELLTSVYSGVRVTMLQSLKWHASELHWDCSCFPYMSLDLLNILLYELSQPVPICYCLNWIVS